MILKKVKFYKKVNRISNCWKTELNSVFACFILLLSFKVYANTETEDEGGQLNSNRSNSQNINNECNFKIAKEEVSDWFLNHLKTAAPMLKDTKFQVGFFSNTLGGWGWGNNWGVKVLIIPRNLPDNLSKALLMAEEEAEDLDFICETKNETLERTLKVWRGTLFNSDSAKIWQMEAYSWGIRISKRKETEFWLRLKKNGLIVLGGVGGGVLHEVLWGNQLITKNRTIGFFATGAALWIAPYICDYNIRIKSTRGACQLMNDPKFLRRAAKFYMNLNELSLSGKLCNIVEQKLSDKIIEKLFPNSFKTTARICLQEADKIKKNSKD